MSEDAELRQMRRDLLKRFAAGEIDKAAYDQALAEIRQLADESAGGQTEPMPTTGQSDTKDFDPKYQSIGRWQTLAPSPGSSMQLGSFRLEEKIGRGGMGEVWKAYDQTAERFVVVKVVPPELQQHSGEMARVKDTFGRIHALQHEHICPLYLLGEDDVRGYYLVMKYIQGQPLSDYRSDFVKRHGSFPVEEVIRLLAPVAAALDYAHSMRVVHRDVKPENIMVVGQGQDVQVVDFGLAAEIRTSVSRVSRVQMETSGTYPYMAPEQWRGEYQDARTDQYALAVVAYELLSGRLPFEAPDSAVMRLCVLNDPVPPLDDQPEHANRAIGRAMSKDRQERFGNCREFVEALHGAGQAEEPTEDEAPVILAEVVEEETVQHRRPPEPADAFGRPVMVPGSEKPYERASDSNVQQEAADRFPVWLDLAAKGDPACQYLVGLCWFKGWVVPQDYEKAFDWFRKAGAQGYTEAQFRMGQCYQQGDGLRQDREAAVRWYKRAAQQGHVESQYRLGKCHQSGSGAEKGPMEAARWFRMAADNGHAEARKSLESLPWWATIVQGPWLDQFR